MRCSGLVMAGAEVDGLGGKRSSYLDLHGAQISGRPEAAEWAHTDDGAPSISLPQQQEVSHFAIDIGGSLIKLVYFVPGSHEGGRLHFAKFETANVDECITFIEKLGLHQQLPSGELPSVKATGGGAYKFAETFKERLGISLDKEDEVQCLVSGTDFLLANIEEEAFTFPHGQRRFISMRNNTVYPYLLVNVGSGVSILKVDRSGCRRVSGTNIGGGTFWGLCRLLTGVESFDEMLKLSTQGDNENVDMLVGDIYGGLDYSKLGLSSSTIASSFGKVVMDNKTNIDSVDRADVALSLLRMISYNIGHLGVMNALQHDVRHIFFGGYFIRNHPFTMETISIAVAFWSNSRLSAKFMRHEGFLGALGAFLACEDTSSSERPHLLVHQHDHSSNGTCASFLTEGTRM